MLTNNLEDYFNNINSYKGYLARNQNKSDLCYNLIIIVLKNPTDINDEHSFANKILSSIRDWISNKYQVYNYDVGINISVYCFFFKHQFKVLLLMTCSFVVFRDLFWPLSILNVSRVKSDF